MLKYYDQSLYPALRKLIPARAKPDIGVLVEPNIFERPKVITGKDPIVTTENIRGTIDVTKDIISVTASFNTGVSVATSDAYSDTISISRTTESGSVIVATGSYDTYDGTITELKERNFDYTVFQKFTQPGLYSDVTMSNASDSLAIVKEVHQPIISGSRIYGRNQKTARFYTTEASHSANLPNSSSFFDVDLDNLVEQSQAKMNSFYAGVKNTSKTTIDGGRPIEIVITSPTKLVTQESGDSTLKTGDGKVSDFKFKDQKQKPVIPKVSDSGFKADGTIDIVEAQKLKGNIGTIKEVPEVAEELSPRLKKKKRKKKRIQGDKKKKK